MTRITTGTQIGAQSEKGEMDMTDEKPSTWGYTNAGTRVMDTKSGNEYVTNHQDGWVVLVSKTTEERLSFEALDDIDYNRFNIL